MIKQKELFERIFSDAHVLDIDMSMWDKRIALYVIADHVGRVGGNRLPMFVVEFTRVHSFNIDFNHLTYNPPIDLASDEHVQWRIDHYDVKSTQNGIEIVLGTFNTSSSPQTVLVCEDIDIWELTYDDLDTLFPGWERPYSGFIRPGLDVMLGYGYADRLQGREYADRRLQGIKKGRR